MLSLDESIKKQIGAGTWLRRNLVTLVVISLINFYSLTVFNAAIWPEIHVPSIPEPPAPWKFYLHAGFYTVILYLAGIVGERVRSQQELTMTMARKHTQQALAAHDAQVQQQIRAMTARGEPLAPLAAATISPEAARMNVAATGGDTALLDRMGSHSVPPSPSRQVVAIAPTVPDEDEPEGEEDEDPIPTGRYNAKRLTARLEATR